MPLGCGKTAHFERSQREGFLEYYELSLQNHPSLGTAFLGAIMNLWSLECGYCADFLGALNETVS